MRCEVCGVRCALCGVRFALRDVCFVMCVVLCATFFVQFIPRPKTGTQSLKAKNVFSKRLLVLLSQLSNLVCRLECYGKKSA